MRSLILKNLQGKKILLLFVVTMSVYLVMIFITIPWLVTYSKGLSTLDMLPTGYDHKYALSLFQALGEEGRDYYLSRQLPLDFFYPGLFAVTYALLFAYLLRKLDKQDSKWFVIAYLPILSGVADYLENIGIINMLLTFPDISATVIELTNYCSIVKSFSTSIYFVALLVLLGIFGYSKLTRRATQNPRVPGTEPKLRV
ncbi:hypothetical protein [Pontibacter ruber]|uniref:Uncharacterized protein n=1 Tax=Pontibacter ruber TaxID=1343895 RepID=A0ABW5D0Y5_9BACT|nr:hypothetical protein [Pontibacter ruber]